MKDLPNFSFPELEPTKNGKLELLPCDAGAGFGVLIGWVRGGEGILVACEESWTDVCILLSRLSRSDFVKIASCM